MDVMCSICFQPGELYQVAGYSLPTCIKCSEQLANKGTFYQQQQQPQPPPPRPSDQMQQPNGSISNVAPQPSHHQTPAQQQPPPHHQPTQPQSTNNTGNTNGNNASASESENSQVNTSQIKKEVNIFELEQSLMNMESEYLFGDDGSCPLCTKTFTRRASLLNHIRNHSAERKYVCNHCQKGFTQAANLRNHERIHTNERPYVCIDCAKAFTQITNLNNHRRLHTGERPFVCIEENCGRSFAQVTNLNNHMKTHHKIQQYVCNQCPRKFAQVSQLNIHLTSHTGIREFFCPQCPNKSFKQQSHLLQHMKIHGTDIGYPCEKCDEKFLQLTHLEHHMKMHDTCKFKCEMCPSSFNQEALLKKHIQRHIDGRYLMCPIVGCSEGFTIKSQLTKHLHMQHASESNIPKRPSTKKSKKDSSNNASNQQHNCSFQNCTATFNNVNSLNDHLRTVHGQPAVKSSGSSKKSKVDPMLLEQLENARKNNAVDAAALGQSFNFLLANGTPFLGGGDHLDPNSAAHHKRMLSVAELLDLSEQAKKVAAAQANGHNVHSKPVAGPAPSFLCVICAINFSTEEDLRQHNFFKHPDKKHMGQMPSAGNVSGMQVIDGNAGHSGGAAAAAPPPPHHQIPTNKNHPQPPPQQQHQQPHHQPPPPQNHILLQQHQQHTNNREIFRSIYFKSDGRLTCPFCFNVFKSQSRLARHIGKFHN